MLLSATLVLAFKLCFTSGMRNGPETLQFNRLVKEFREVFSKIPDPRQQNRPSYPLPDVVTAGLAMMFWQDPGVLPFQQRLQDQAGSSNLKSMFSVDKVPKETQFRDLLDSVDPEYILSALRRGISLLSVTRKWLDFKALDGRYLVGLDATGYFHSEKIHCDRCLEKHHEDGRVEYYHQVLVASLIHPITGQSFPLCAEEIRREDGQTKQDCEINAAYRLLPYLSKRYCHLDMVLLADGLYSKTPMIELARSLKMNFIFVAKPSDHKHLTEQLTGLRLSGEVSTIEKTNEQKKVLQKLEFAKEVPVFAKNDLICNWVSISEGAKGKKAGYKNTWLTDLKPTSKNVAEIAAAGRHRWSIENQTFNALKNQGYNFEHNFGHGKKNLRFNFLLLNLLAFLMHQLLEIGDQLYAQSKTWKKTLKEFVEHVRWAVRLALWPDWTTLLNSYLGRGPKLRLDTG